MTYHENLIIIIILFYLQTSNLVKLENYSFLFYIFIYKYFTHD